MKIKIDILLISILLLACVFRFTGLNWDNNFHLHPDERFLTMVGNQMKIPSTFFQYLDQKTSSMNPQNIGFPFFVYGIFPLVLNKIVAVFLHNDSYSLFTLQGRFLSGLADIGLLFFLYKFCMLLEKKNNLHGSVKYISIFLYAISILPIQLSHFFAVDTFLNFFMFASFYYTYLFSYSRKNSYIFLSAFFFSLALSSKLSAIFIIPLLLFFLLYNTFRKKHYKKSIIIVCIFFIISYFFVRLFSPYMFESGNIFSMSISKKFIENITVLQSFNNPTVWFPPSVQWIHKTPVLFSLTNLAIFGIGIPYFFFVLLGIFSLLLEKKKLDLLIICSWVILFFFYQSVQFIKVMRYFIFIYPFLALLGAIGIDYIVKEKNIIWKISATVLLLISPLSFMSIYIHPHSRILASEWIYEHIPNNSKLLVEHWDDPLPLFVINNSQKQFITQSLPIFDIDTPEKWTGIYAFMQNGDYIILSSNRGWGSIPTVPEKYPLTTAYYANLLNNKLSYKKVAEFTSYPSLRYLGIPFEFADDWADESFAVYDHPKVIILKKI